MKVKNLIFMVMVVVLAGFNVNEARAQVNSSNFYSKSIETFNERLESEKIDSMLEDTTVVINNAVVFLPQTLLIPSMITLTIDSYAPKLRCIGGGSDTRLSLVYRRWQEVNIENLFLKSISCVDDGTGVLQLKQVKADSLSFGIKIYVDSSVINTLGLRQGIIRNTTIQSLCIEGNGPIFIERDFIDNIWWGLVDVDSVIITRCILGEQVFNTWPYYLRTQELWKIKSDTLFFQFEDYDSIQVYYFDSLSLYYSYSETYANRDFIKIDTTRKWWIMLFDGPNTILGPHSYSSSYVEKNSNIKVYPNPATDFVNIEGLDDSSSWEIYDERGKIVKKDSGSNERKIYVGDLLPGIYIVKFNGKSSLKVIKQ